MPNTVHVPPPGSFDDDDFTRTARRFVRAYYVLLAEDTEPGLAAIAPWQLALLDALNGDATIGGTANGLRMLHQNQPDVAHLLVGEMDAFSALVAQWSAPEQPTHTSSRAAAASPADAAAETPGRSWWKRLLGVGRTAADSVKDILDNHLGPREKQIWKLCTELLEILRGD